jgi:hypothetical protein
MRPWRLRIRCRDGILLGASGWCGCPPIDDLTGVTTLSRPYRQRKAGERSNDERGRFSPAERDEGYLACKDWSWRGKAADSLGCLRS